MARYIKDFQINVDPQKVHATINNYLQKEGYEYIHYDGENVFKKGKGFMSNPTFFKFSYSGNMVRMETWMKYAFFPGVYLGELGVDGFVGCAVKGSWKNRIKNIENILADLGMQTTYYSPASAQNAVSNQQVYSQADVYNLTQEATIPPRGDYISRKEFIDQYIEPSLRKNIASIAILCYVCAGLTFVVSCLSNPIGIIDALILTGLALGMHLAKSRICAILILIFSIIEVLLALVSGSFPFWWLLAGISAVTTFSKIEKQYKQFLNR